MNSCMSAITFLSLSLNAQSGGAAFKLWCTFRGHWEGTERGWGEGRKVLEKWTQNEKTPYNVMNIIMKLLVEYLLTLVFFEFFLYLVK